MAGESAKLRREIEGFKQSTAKLSTKINEAGSVWKDANYATLSSQIGELAKSSRTVIESGEKTCSSIDKFFTTAAEDI
jgi:hypothetical protein